MGLACGDSLGGDWTIPATAKFQTSSGVREVSFQAQPYGSLLEAEHIAWKEFEKTAPSEKDEKSRLISVAYGRQAN